MNKMLIYNYLLSKVHSGEQITIKVSGTSMQPTMYNGDCVTIISDKFYCIGDILVFIYKGELLVHRLVKIENDRFFCKGDNSFRLEDLVLENIVGKVIYLNNLPLPLFSDENIALSYLVNREFRKCGYNIEKTKNSGIYRFYCQKVWNIEDKTLQYRLNRTTSNSLLNRLLNDDCTSKLEFKQAFKDINIDFYSVMFDFCDFNTLLTCFSERLPISSDDICNVAQTFLTKGIIKKLIEVC